MRSKQENLLFPARSELWPQLDSLFSPFLRRRVASFFLPLSNSWASALARIYRYVFKIPSSLSQVHLRNIALPSFASSSVEKREPAFAFALSLFSVMLLRKLYAEHSDSFASLPFPSSPPSTTPAFAFFDLATQPSTNHVHLDLPSPYFPSLPHLYLLPQSHERKGLRSYRIPYRPFVPIQDPPGVRST